MDMNMYEYIKDRKQYLPEIKVKNYMYQMFVAIEHMHRNNIFHRDIKPENVLVAGEVAKLADLGSCKSMTSPMPCTEYISTRWYRSPECLMTDGYYDFKMDVWGAGCVFFEVLSLYPLFQGANELDQVKKIHDILGTPDEQVLKDFEAKATHMKFDFPRQKGTGIDVLIPHVSVLCRDLLNKMLAYKTSERPTMAEVLKHSYFKSYFENTQTLVVDCTLSSSSYIEKSPGILPPIKNSFPKKKDKTKAENSSKTLGFLENSPYSVKKSILELRKAYAPTNKKFYKSSY